MKNNKLESICSIFLLILSVFLFFTKKGGVGFFVFLIGLGLYIYSRRDSDYRSI